MPYKNSTDLPAPPELTPLSKPIRILHVVGGMDRGGAETWLMHILRNIDRQQFQMDFLVHTDQHYAYSDEAQSLGSKIIVCPGRYQSWVYTSSFKKILKEHGPYDIVHTHLHHFSGFALYLAKQAGIPVRVIHSHIDTSSIELKAKWQRQIYTALTKWLIDRYATVGLAASQMAADDLLGLAWENDPRWQLIYYGIDLAPFHEPVERADILAEFDIPADALVVGHVGRFEPQKNHHFLIEIATEIAKREPNMRLLLLGIGSLRTEIEEKVASLGLIDKVIFAGSRPDVPQLMKGVMDVFLFPSCYEGLGIVLVEAQAAGLPCVFSDVVPVEADVVKPLVQRVSLEKSATDWAEVVLATKNKNSSVTKVSALEILSKSVFNIEVSLQELTKFYSTTVAVSRSSVK
jgi:glycosyltransferase involved in cell wall biosynthesis